MTLMAKNADKVDETIAAIRQVIPDFRRSELHLNVGHESGHYFDNVGYPVEPHHVEILRAIEDHRKKNGSGLHPVKFLEDRYQALIGKYYETGKSPLPCTALSSSCFIDAYWNLYACSIWDAKVGNLRENAFDLRTLWDERPPPAAARGRGRGALLTLLDAVRGVSHDPRQSRARRGVARSRRAGAGDGSGSSTSRT